MEKYGFAPKIPLVIVAKVNALDERTVERAGAAVRDLRHLLWSSMSNPGDTGIDQVEYCERGQGGSIIVKVAIADVDAYAPKGSLLDAHAETNATTVHAGAEKFPMLPESLSSDLSSLSRERDKLAVVVEFSVMPRGNIRPGKVYQAAVRNKAELEYWEVGEWLKGGETPELVDDTQGLEGQLRLQEEASTKIGNYLLQAVGNKMQDAKPGATQDAKPGSAHDAKPGSNEGYAAIRLVDSVNGSSESIITNFTAGVNDTVACFLEGANLPVIKRVIKAPKHWNDMVNLAKARGAALPAEPDAGMLANFMEKEKTENPAGIFELSSSIARLLGSGEYAVFTKESKPEYFCLAPLGHANRATPNQRYMDLVIQRLLKAAATRSVLHYSDGELSELAEWCTDREHAAKKVERVVARAGGAALLTGKIGKTFDAVITSVSENGAYARLTGLPVDGMITGKCDGVQVGQKVKVRLVDLDPPRGFVDLEIIG